MATLYGTPKNGLREILLTFDDGPHPVNTPKLLDVLAVNDIKAVFFMVGQSLQTPAGKALLARVRQEGHLAGNHSYSHPDLSKLTTDKIKDEIVRTRDLIGDAAKGVKLFRPPYGAESSLSRAIVRDLGYETMLWNVDSLDWHPKYKTGAWVEHAMSQIRAREDSTFLAHDIHATTVARVQELIDLIKKIPGAVFIRPSATPLPS